MLHNFIKVQRYYKIKDISLIFHHRLSTRKPVRERLHIVDQEEKFSSSCRVNTGEVCPRDSMVIFTDLTTGFQSGSMRKGVFLASCGAVTSNELNCFFCARLLSTKLCLHTWLVRSK